MLGIDLNFKVRVEVALTPVELFRVVGKSHLLQQRRSFAPEITHGDPGRTMRVQDLVHDPHSCIRHESPKFVAVRVGELLH